MTALDGWDDLRILLAAARAGTVTEGARRLGLDQTTVTRRLRAFEERCGHRLFHRVRGGIELTPQGASFLRAAGDVEARLFELERQTAGGDTLHGRLRFTLPELLAMVWMPGLTAFAAAHPQLQLELVTSHRLKSLTRRESDVALRYVTAPPEHLFGRRLARVGLAVYAHPRLDDVALAELPWIGWDPDEHAIELTDSLRSAFGNRGRYSLFVSDYVALLSALRAGAGAAHVPCIVGDREPELRRRSEVIIQPQHLWLLTHPDLRQSPRVRALMAEVTALVEAERHALEGGMSLPQSPG